MSHNKSQLKSLLLFRFLVWNLLRWNTSPSPCFLWRLQGLSMWCVCEKKIETQKKQELKASTENGKMSEMYLEKLMMLM